MKVLAIIKAPRFGVDHLGRTGLTFGVYVTETLAAPQYLDAQEATVVVTTYRVRDVSELDGKPCWCLLAGNRCVFDSPCLI